MSDNDARKAYVKGRDDGYRAALSDLVEELAGNEGTRMLRDLVKHMAERLALRRKAGEEQA